ncbi:MAG: PDZ domain-containing protein [Spirochaetales bacterium]|nr:PDZ domain-containing protein [Spirochaetales bacterium]
MSLLEFGLQADIFNLEYDLQIAFNQLKDENPTQAQKLAQFFPELFPEFVSQPEQVDALSISEEQLQRGTSEPKVLWAHRVLDAHSKGSVDLGNLTDQSLSEELETLSEEVQNLDLRQLLGLKASRFDPSQAVQAVVTVLVDQGVEVTGGIGRPILSVGSGLFIDPEGYILTNYHVIESEVDPTYEGVSKLTVRLFTTEGRALAQRVPARVVGYDEVLDIAMLKVEVTPRSVVSLSNIETLVPGTEVFALGSPGGLENTLTRGIISALGRRFLQLGEVYQVDIPLNPGNSGGPVFDSQGRVLGIVFAGIQQFDGVNFIIPSTQIYQVLPKLFEGGQVRHNWIGASVHETSRGLEISFIDPNGPLGTSVLRIGDLVRSIDGFRFTNIPQVHTYLGKLNSDELVILEVEREGNRYRVPIVLGERPVLPLQRVLGPVLASRWLSPLFGIGVDRLENRNGRPSFQITRVYPGSIAHDSGLTEYDSFALDRWIYDEEQQVAAIQILVQRRSMGLVPEALQIATYIALTSFI